MGRRNVHHHRRRGLHGHLRDAAVLKQSYSTRKEAPDETGKAAKAMKAQKARKA
jgi:hypothetical protein